MLKSIASASVGTGFYDEPVQKPDAGVAGKAAASIAGLDPDLTSVSNSTKLGSR